MNLTFILLSLLTILNIIFHITHIYSKDGFKNFYTYVFSLVIFIVYTLSIFIIFTKYLLDKYSNLYFLIFLLYHLLAFLLIYFSLILISFIVKYLSIFLSPKINLIPQEYELLKTPIYKNTKFLKKTFLISYLLSTVIFVFVFKNYLFLEIKKTSGIDINLLKDDISLYYNTFFIASLTLLGIFKKKI
ncbi:hypothetical protein HMPREF3222_03114 [Clostridium perfringens]|uniref:Uncharacterized protein n=1 Tax=Clostridium perfringens TaxID=1502 RepID=A0A133MLX5_CLOPF|nr:hypothetical protein HMPREF3222_03114 [Clostridium perfringens]